VRPLSPSPCCASRLWFDHGTIRPDVSQVIVAEAALQLAVVGGPFRAQRSDHPGVEQPLLRSRRLAQIVAAQHYLRRGELRYFCEQRNQFALIAGEFVSSEQVHRKNEHGSEAGLNTLGRGV